MSKKLGIIGIIFLLILSAKVISQINQNSAKKKNIQEEIILVNEKNDNLRKQIKKYEERIAALEDDFEKEKLARNMQKMVKPDEVIYKYVEKPKKDNYTEDENSQKVEEEK